MKILETGVLEAPPRYQHRCKSCNCFFEFSESETYRLHPIQPEKRAIMCPMPQCSRASTFSEWQKQ